MGYRLDRKDGTSEEIDGNWKILDGSLYQRNVEGNWEKVEGSSGGRITDVDTGSFLFIGKNIHGSFFLPPRSKNGDDDAPKSGADKSPSDDFKDWGDEIGELAEEAWDELTDFFEDAWDEMVDLWDEMVDLWDDLSYDFGSSG